EIVPIGDSRFLFCDNNLGDVLLELRLDGDGGMAGPLVRRPLVGLADDAVDDLEGMAIVKHRRRTWIFATPSLSLKLRKRKTRAKSKRGKVAPGRNGLLRVAARGGRLEAEVMPAFRDWFIA